MDFKDSFTGEGVKIPEKIIENFHRQVNGTVGEILNEFDEKSFPDDMRLKELWEKGEFSFSECLLCPLSGCPGKFLTKV